MLFIIPIQTMTYKRQKQYRLPGYDYAGPGEYFLTICTKDRQHFLGEISQGRMQLSEAGGIAKKILREIPGKFENVLLDEWVIMPNHIHMILMIYKEGRNMINHVPTVNHVPAKNKSGILNNPMELPYDTIGKIIRWYKGRVKFECGKQDLSYFAWQARFHDHIVRNARDLERIRQYLRDNPLRWDIDGFNQ